jgi:hypothetical protein
MAEKMVIGIPVIKPKQLEDYVERDNPQINFTEEIEQPDEVDDSQRTVDEEPKGENKIHKPRFAIGHKLSKLKYLF